MSSASRRSFAAALLAGLPAFALTMRPAAHAAGRTLRIGYQRSSTLWTILKEHRTLEKRLAGYDISWNQFDGVIEPMNAGSVELHPDVADAVPIFTQASGAPLTFYAREAPSPSAEAIIVHADSSIRSVADLRGKTVGVSRGSGAHFLLAAALKREGLSFQDIRPAYLQAAPGAAAFDGRSIDAWSIWDPYLAITQAKGAVRTIADGTGFTSYYRYYLANDSFVAEHPEIVQIVFDELVEAGRWIRKNPTATAELLSPLWGDVPAATVEVVIARRSHVVQPIVRAELSEQQQIADTFFEAGLIPKKLAAADVRIWRPAAG
jgi:sulfonate transport system substrate-binding protein